MRSLPEVIKTNYFIHNDIKVKIPDIDFRPQKPAETLPPVVKEIIPELKKQVEPPKPEIRTVIKEIYRDPEPLTREDIERIYAQEIQEICREAEVKAYSDALAEKEEEIENCIGEVEKLLDEIRSSQGRYMENYVRELKYFAIEVAEKMILEKINEDDSILNKMIMQAVAGVKNTQWLRVEVSDRLSNLTEFLKSELSKPEYRGLASVLPVAAPEDTCRVCTESGSTIATVSVQAENLRKAFSEMDESDS